MYTDVYFNDSKEVLSHIVNHSNYLNYKEYLEHWKEELEEDSNDRAEKICNMFNLVSVGNGDRRVCCLYNNVIVKLPLESCHYDSNENEYNLYNYIKDNHSEFLDLLCPIIDYSDGVLVTPSCEELDMDEDDFYDFIEDLDSKFVSIGIKFTDLDKQDQFGILGDKIVIVDYEDYEFVNKSTDSLLFPTSIF